VDSRLGGGGGGSEVLEMSLVEEMMALRGASAWIAIGGVITLLGAGIGGAASLIGAWLKSREEAAKYHEQMVMIAGAEDTFCQLTIYIDRDGPGWFLSNLHHGPGGPIYDVQVLVTEVTEDGTPLPHTEKLMHVGTMTSVTSPLMLYALGQPKDLAASGKPRYFNAQATQRNGVAVQEIVVYPRPKGFVELGFLRLDFNGKPAKPSNKLLLKNISKLIEIPETTIGHIKQLRAEREARRQRRLEDPKLDLTLPRERL
jgi:hypothetical protein